MYVHFDVVQCQMIEIHSSSFYNFIKVIHKCLMVKIHKPESDIVIVMSL